METKAFAQKIKRTLERMGVGFSKKTHGLIKDNICMGFN